MNLRFLIACLLVWSLALVARAEDYRCALCGRAFGPQETVYDREDTATGKTEKYCAVCEKLDTVCFFCNRPVKDDYVSLGDGRLACQRDYAEMIHSNDEAKRIAEDVRDELNRSFSRFMSYSSENVAISFVNKVQLEELFQYAGEEHAVSIYGATRSTHLVDGKGFMHSVGVLSDLKKPRLMAVCAHEFTHTWINENVSDQRKAALSPATVEGLCELMAYNIMENHQEAFETENIKQNHYTRGQILLFIEAQERYGLNAILDWMKAGEDVKLEAGSLDRIRVVKTESELASGKPAKAAVQLVLPPVAAVVPVHGPDKLLLKGISGTPQRRFALINDGTFEAMERGKVRLGQSNVVIRCLEIRNASVVVQAEGSGAKQELFLRAQLQ